MKILNLNHELKKNTSSGICKLDLIFSSILVLTDQSKWRANKNKNGEGYNAHPKIALKIINSERLFNPS